MITDNVVFSVVIPCKNRADKLPRAIHSVLCQTFDSYEIIICDDGSSDDTASVVKDFADRYPGFIRYLSWSEPKGAGFARNQGMNAASGDYIAFLDSDDAWLPTKLEEEFEVLAHSARGVCISGAIRIVTGKKKSIRLQIPNKRLEKSVLKEFILGYVNVPTACLTFNKQLIELSGNMKTQMIRNQDNEFFLRLLFLGELKVIDHELAIIYTELSEQKSHTQSVVKAFPYWMENRGEIERICGRVLFKKFKGFIVSSIVATAFSERQYLIAARFLLIRFCTFIPPSKVEVRKLMSGIYNWFRFSSKIS